MNDTLLITLKSLRLPNKCPEIQFCGKSLTLTDEITAIPVNVNIGLNLIEISFLNKSNKDTKVVDGIIVADLAVIVEKLEYRGHDFHPYLQHISNYIDQNGNEIRDTHGFMAFNGTMTIKLFGPLFVYLRDLAIQHG